MEFRRKYIKFNWPAVAGQPITYQKGDLVRTKDGREGTVVSYSFDDGLTLYKNGEPSRGHFVVTVDFGGYTSKFFRHDLSGKHLHGGFW